MPQNRTFRIYNSSSHIVATSLHVTKHQFNVQFSGKLGSLLSADPQKWSVKNLYVDICPSWWQPVQPVTYYWWKARTLMSANTTEFCTNNYWFDAV